MTFWGVGPKGEKLLLGEPAEASLSYDRDAPADLLRAVFPADRMWDELSEVVLYQGGEAVFRGIVDEQNTALSASGITVELVCRSLEALLLDNEAEPGTVNSPSLPLLEERLLLPLGLSLGDGDRRAVRGQLTVEKGESCWAVLERFCREALGTVPHTDASGKVNCGGTAGQSVELSEALSARVELSPCRRVSEVWQQSFRGSYDTPYRSGRPGVKRRRYLSVGSGEDPRQVLAEGERDSFLFTVTCAGAWWPGRNGLASVTLPGLGRFEGCPVRSVRYFWDRQGERTRLTLERPEEGLEGREKRACG